jgi:hypothetical protein
MTVVPILSRCDPLQYVRGLNDSAALGQTTESAASIFRDLALILSVIADLFNHSASGCMLERIVWRKMAQNAGHQMAW